MCWAVVGQGKSLTSIDFNFFGTIAKGAETQGRASKPLNTSFPTNQKARF
jgi:hypothetical protein